MLPSLYLTDSDNLPSALTLRGNESHKLEYTSLLVEISLIRSLNNAELMLVERLALVSCPPFDLELRKSDLAIYFFV